MKPSLRRVVIVLVQFLVFIYIILYEDDYIDIVSAVLSLDCGYSRRVHLDLLPIIKKIHCNNFPIQINYLKKPSNYVRGQFDPIQSVSKNRIIIEIHVLYTF